MLKFIVRLPIVAKIADIEVGSILPRKRESRLDIFIGRSLEQPTDFLKFEKSFETNSRDPQLV